MTCAEQSHVDPLTLLHTCHGPFLTFLHVRFCVESSLRWVLSFSQSGFIPRVVFLKDRFDRELMKCWGSSGTVYPNCTEAALAETSEYLGLNVLFSFALFPIS